MPLVQAACCYKRAVINAPSKYTLNLETRFRMGRGRTSGLEYGWKRGQEGDQRRHDD